MIVEITATVETEIRDLGIILAENEFINLLNNFNKEDLLQSADLETAINNINVTVSIDGLVVNYEDFIDKISSFTKYEHNTLNKIQHNLYKDNYFKTTKLNGTTKYITYYTDETMTEKIQEDEVIRDVSGKVSQIVSRIYENGLVVQELNQLLNRDVSGKVESITTNAQ